MDLFIVIPHCFFVKPALVVTPFLPGDSLIFAAGALSAMGSLNVVAFFMTFFVAAVVGDTVNYYIGKKIGNTILEKGKNKFVKKEYIIKAHKFYEKHGAMTIRYRTIYSHHPDICSICSGNGRNELLQVHYLQHPLGHLCGSDYLSLGDISLENVPIVKDNFSLVLIAIIVISVLPAVIAVVRERKSANA